MLSVIIPAYCEEENLPILVESLIPVLEHLNRDYEVIVVNDGSTDRTEETLNTLAKSTPKLRVINLSRNFGQTAAMMAGFDHARGSTLISMDADLQNDPADIPNLLAALDEGYDVVSGWRKDRKDHKLLRVLPSRAANLLASWITGVRLNDFGCTLKAYRRDALEDVRLYGEMHRFIPAFAAWRGARVKEITVTHHARHSGTSSYGLSRVFKVLMDLLVLKFLITFTTKPIYVFGSVSFVLMGISGGALGYAGYLKFFEGTSLIETPLPLLSAMCFVSGLMCFLMGLIAELVVRTYFESHNRKTYVIKSTVNLEPYKSCVA